MSEEITKPISPELLIRAMAAFALCECHDDLWWRCDNEYAPITLFVNCNDLFYWACADAVCVSEDNIELLEATAKELHDINEKERSSHACYPCTNPEAHSHSTIYLDTLFCCRVRQMRPQDAWFRKLALKEPIRSLIMACGEERSKGDEDKPWVEMGFVPREVKVEENIVSKWWKKIKEAI